MLDHARIRAILPHRDAMVLVDRILSLDPGVAIVGIKAITGSEPCYHGLPDDLAPERYAYPISLLVESFGQTAAILWRGSVDHLGEDRDSVLMFVATRDLRIHGRAFPGDILRHVARLENVVGDHVFVAGETWAGDRRIATIGSMMAAARPRAAVLGHSTRGRE